MSSKHCYNAELLGVLQKKNFPEMALTIVDKIWELWSIYYVCVCRSTIVVFFYDIYLNSTLRERKRVISLDASVTMRRQVEAAFLVFYSFYVVFYSSLSYEAIKSVSTTSESRVSEVTTETITIMVIRIISSHTPKN